MATILVALLVVSLLVWVWNDNRMAQERAIASVRLVLRGSEAQLLDETVALQRLRLVRNTAGRVAISRTYGFEVSSDGVSREAGRLTLTGDAVEVLDLPPGLLPARRRVT